MNALGKQAAAAVLPWALAAAAVYVGVRYVLPKLGAMLPAAGGAVGTAVGSIAAGAAQVPYSVVNGVGAGISGDDDWTLGGWLYDLTHDEYDPNALTGSAAMLAPDRQTVTREQAGISGWLAGTDSKSFWGEW